MRDRWPWRRGLAPSRWLVFLVLVVGRSSAQSSVSLDWADAMRGRELTGLKHFQVTPMSPDSMQKSLLIVKSQNSYKISGNSVKNVKIL